MHDTSYFNQMVNTSQNINLSYGYLWWLNGKASFHLPGTQFQFNGFLVPHAPADMIAALGKNDQILNIVPSMGLVMIRMGDPMFAVNEVANFSNDSIWVRLNAVMCSATDLEQLNTTGSLSIFPNPAGSEISIAFSKSQQPFEVAVSNTLGQTLISKQNETHFNISKLNKGIYFVTIKSGRNFYAAKLEKY
jgi:hypothetical protein